MAGTLYIVATPIGNLEDITLRAIKILKDVDIILAEDTRVTKKLIAFLNFQFPQRRTLVTISNFHLISYHQYSSEKKRLDILRYLLEGKDLAVVTDAGTPGISDPGNELIDFILRSDSSISIVPVPGVSAVTSALSVCGFRADKFVFLGFLPKKKRSKLFEWLKVGKFTFAFYESPHRITKTLEVIQKEFGDVWVFMARELTKIHETLYRGKVNDILVQISGQAVKGEIVVIVDLSNKLSSDND